MRSVPPLHWRVPGEHAVVHAPLEQPHGHVVASVHPQPSALHVRTVLPLHRRAPGVQTVAHAPSEQPQAQLVPPVQPQPSDVHDRTTFPSQRRLPGEHTEPHASSAHPQEQVVPLLHAQPSDSQVRSTSPLQRRAPGSQVDLHAPPAQPQGHDGSSTHAHPSARHVCGVSPRQRRAPGVQADAVHAPSTQPHAHAEPSAQPQPSARHVRGTVPAHRRLLGVQTCGAHAPPAQPHGHDGSHPAATHCRSRHARSRGHWSSRRHTTHVPVAVSQCGAVVPAHPSSSSQRDSTHAPSVQKRPAGQGFSDEQEAHTKRAGSHRSGASQSGLGAPLSPGVHPGSQRRENEQSFPRGQSASLPQVSGGSTQARGAPRQTCPAGQSYLDAHAPGLPPSTPPPSGAGAAVHVPRDRSQEEPGHSASVVQVLRAQRPPRHRNSGGPHWASSSQGVPAAAGGTCTLSLQPATAASTSAAPGTGAWRREVMEDSRALPACR